MPWIVVTVPPRESTVTSVDVASSQRWATHCAATVAALLGLDTLDVIVLVMRAEASSSLGSVVTVCGRHRGDEAETALVTLLQREVALWLALDNELVIVRRN